MKNDMQICAADHFPAVSTALSFKGDLAPDCISFCVSHKLLLLNPAENERKSLCLQRSDLE